MHGEVLALLEDVEVARRVRTVRERVQLAVLRKKSAQLTSPRQQHLPLLALARTIAVATCFPVTFRGIQPSRGEAPDEEPRGSRCAR